MINFELHQARIITKTSNKVEVLILALLFCVSVSKAQTTYGDFLSSNKLDLADEIIKPTVQSPDVAAFQKANFIPTNNYTGRAEVSVPIYTIEYGGMQVPVSLSYNTSGVKVADMASRVGLNWSLNAGGVVSRVIQGMDDFTYPKFLGYDANMLSPAGWLAPLNPNTQSGTENPHNDPLPDKYVINAAGLGTEFITRSNGEAIDLRRSGNIIDPSFDIINRSYKNSNGSTVTSNVFALKSLLVTSMAGIRYSFETPEFSNIAGGGFDVPTNWLDSMTNLNTGQTISFEYESFSNYYHDDTELYVTTYGGGTYNSFADKDQYTYYPLGQRLKSITFGTGKVEFIYGMDRQDYPGEKVLTEIRIKDANEKITKHFKLSHSYFQSSLESGTPESKRLKLNEVYEVDSYGIPKSGHQFYYNTGYTMPPRDSYAYDFLGYNNGSYSASIANPEPKMYFYQGKITPINRSGSIALPGNYSMLSNSSYAKAYSLRKIELPTGGSKEFEYELNQFLYKGQTIYGGGLRVKTQYLKASDGEDQIIDYEYSAGKIGLMPSYAAIYLKTSNYSNPSSLSSLTSQLGIETFSNPQTQIEFNNGSFVAYSKVTVNRRNSSAYTTYSYSQEDNTPSSKTNPTNFSLNAISDDWRTLNDGMLFLDNDFMRGLLLSKIMYDEGGEVVSRVWNTYELQKTQKNNQIGLTFYNVVNNSCSRNIGSYQTSSEYFENCGGYKEIIDLVPSRFVLKTSSNTDYGLEGEDPIIQDLTQGVFVEKKFFYDKEYPIVTTEFISNYESDSQLGTTTDSKNAFWESRKDITYPVTGNDLTSPSLNSYPHAQDLFNQNRVSTPMEIEITGRSYSKQLFEYDQFQSGVVSIKKVQTILRDNETLKTAEVLSRNDYGMPTEILQKNGKTLSIIYGYQQSQIIAMVNGENYSSINSWLNSDYNKSISYLSQLSDADTNTSSEAALRSWLNNLRNSIESRSPGSTTIQTFTYDPMIGITSVTDERGNTSYYDYDQFDRLRSVKNTDSNLLQYFQYNLKN